MVPRGGPDRLNVFNWLGGSGTLTCPIELQGFFPHDVPPAADTGRNRQRSEQSISAILIEPAMSHSKTRLNPKKRAATSRTGPEPKQNSADLSGNRYRELFRGAIPASPLHLAIQEEIG